MLAAVLTERVLQIMVFAHTKLNAPTNLSAKLSAPTTKLDQANIDNIVADCNAAGGATNWTIQQGYDGALAAGMSCEDVAKKWDAE